MHDVKYFFKVVLNTKLIIYCKLFYLYFRKNIFMMQFTVTDIKQNDLL